MQIPRNEFSLKFQGTLQIGQKVIIRLRRNIRYRLRPETISPLSASHYPKQLPLSCVLRLISASADRIGSISNICSMMKLLHELKNRSC